MAENPEETLRAVETDEQAVTAAEEPQPAPADSGSQTVRLSDLRIGTRESDSVRALQQALNEAEQGHVWVNGVYATGTAALVATWQRHNDYEVNGDEVTREQAEALGLTVE